MGLCVVWGWKGWGLIWDFFCFNVWGTADFLLAVLSANKLHSVEMGNATPGQYSVGTLRSDVNE